MKTKKWKVKNKLHALSYVHFLHVLFANIYLKIVKEFKAINSIKFFSRWSEATQNSDIFLPPRLNGLYIWNGWMEWTNNKYRAQIFTVPTAMRIIIVSKSCQNKRKKKRPKKGFANVVVFFLSSVVLKRPRPK